MSGNFVATVHQIAAAFGVSARQVQRFADEGMPRPVAGRYDPVGCARWFIERLRAELAALGQGDDLEAQRARAMAAQANLLEHRLKAARAELVPRGIIEAHYRAVMRWVRNAFLDRDYQAMAGQLVGKPRTEIRRLIDGWNRDVLLKLARGEGHPGLPDETPIAEAGEGASPRRRARRPRPAAPGRVEGTHRAIGRPARSKARRP